MNRPKQPPARQKTQRVSIVFAAADAERKSRLHLHGRPVSWAQLTRIGLETLEGQQRAA